MDNRRCRLVPFLAVVSLLILTGLGNAGASAYPGGGQPDASAFQKGLRAERQRHYRSAMVLFKKAAATGSSNAESEIGRL